jgi:hypothetical protein
VSRWFPSGRSSGVSDRAGMAETFQRIFDLVFTALAAAAVVMLI